MLSVWVELNVEFNIRQNRYYCVSFFSFNQHGRLLPFLLRSLFVGSVSPVYHNDAATRYCPLPSHLVAILN